MRIISFHDFIVQIITSDRSCHNKEHNFPGQKVGSEVMSQSLQDSIHNQGTSFESTFEDKSTNNEVAKEEYSLGNEVHDYYDDYSQAHSNSHVYDDYYEYLVTRLISI